MEKLDVLIDKLTNFEQSLYDIVKRAIQDNEQFIISLNTLQMDRGLRSDNSVITPSYEILTVKLKKAKNQPYDRVTLRDSGKFYKSLYIEYHSDHIRISTDETERYFKGLRPKYGKDIYGLTPEDIKLVAQRFVAPRIKKYFKDLVL